MSGHAPRAYDRWRAVDLTHMDQGFVFQRVAPGEDGPLLGVRESADYHDKIYLGDVHSGCTATRARKSSLIVPGGLPVTDQVDGEALIVLHTVVSDWSI
jgi:hypothetical protein